VRVGSARLAGGPRYRGQARRISTRSYDIYSDELDDATSCAAYFYAYQVGTNGAYQATAPGWNYVPASVPRC
jgi:hypothetical protein